MIDLSFQPHRNGLPAGESSSLEVLLRITPTKEANDVATRRAPLNLALVIDRSGSMSGQPLHEARRCADLVVDRLSETDRLAVITYDDHVEVLVPSSPVEDKSRFRRAIASIHEGGTTNLHGGWQAGVTEVAENLQAVGVARVLLISDGKANCGETRVDVIARHCAELAAADVSTSTYGLGERFNEDLMAEMAKSGQGQAHYGRTAEDLIDPFQQEFDLLAALLARKLRLELSPEPGVRVAVLNLFSRDHETGAYILPDIAAGGELWALLRLDVEARVGNGQTKPVRVLSTRLSYTDRQDRRCDTEPAVLYLNPLPATAYAALEADPVVRDRLSEVEVARLADEARQAARRGDWEQVDDIIRRMREIAQGNEWVEKSIEALLKLARTRSTEGFSKEALYKSTRMRTRMTSLDEDSASWSHEAESSKASYLRRKGEEGRRFDAIDGVNGSSSIPRQVIRSQTEWEAIRDRFRNASDYRAFRAGYSFDPNARLEKTGLQPDAVLRPSRAGGARWMIFEGMTDSMSVEEVNGIAKNFPHAERDADIFIALHKGFLRFAGGSGRTDPAP